MEGQLDPQCYYLALPPSILHPWSSCPRPQPALVTFRAPPWVGLVGRGLGSEESKPQT